MQNINPGIPKNEKHPLKRTIFSYNVYRTDHDPRPSFPAKPNHFKSNSTGNWNDPEILYVNEKCVYRKSKRKDAVESSTQTSKTILQLAQMETGCMSPDSLSNSPRDMTKCSMENWPPCSVSNKLSEFTLDGSCQEQSISHEENNFLDKSLTKTFLEKTRNRLLKLTEIAPQHRENATVHPSNLMPKWHPNQLPNSIKSKSFVESYHHPNYIKEPPELKPLRVPIHTVKPIRLNKRSSRSLYQPDSIHRRGRSSIISYHPQNSFMFPTASSQIKSKMPEIQSVNQLIPPMRRGRSTSPKPTADNRRFEVSKKIPYIDQSKSDVSSATTIVNTNRNPEKVSKKNGVIDEDLLKIENLSLQNVSEEGISLITNYEASTSVDNAICSAINKFKEPDWRIALRGLAEIVQLCRVVEVDLIYDYMITINQRLIELLKSPRSHVCRTACQGAGHLFEYIRDTRRPEFDDIVNLLLHKTADANKFIRHDANLALDCMVTHIGTYDAIRVLCTKGPFHKNNLVRCATVRLLICSVVIAGPDFILNPNNNEYTRKRVILNMVRFIEDKNLETRRFGERLYKILCKDHRFDAYLKKYLERDQIIKIKKTLKLVHKK